MKDTNQEKETLHLYVLSFVGLFGTSKSVLKSLHLRQAQVTLLVMCFLAKYDILASINLASYFLCYFSSDFRDFSS